MSTFFLEGGSRLRAGPLSPPYAGWGHQAGTGTLPRSQLQLPASPAVLHGSGGGRGPSPEVGAVDTQTLQKPRPEQRLVGQGAQGSHSEGPGLRDKLVSRDEGTKGLPWVPGRGTRTRARPRAMRWPHLRGVVSTEDRRPERSRAGGTGGSTEWPPRALEPWGATLPAHGPLGPQPPACSHLPGALRQSLPPTSWKKPPQTSSLWCGHVLGWDRRSPRRLEDEEQRRVGRLLPDLVSNHPAAGGRHGSHSSRWPHSRATPRHTGANHALPPATPTHSGRCGRQLRALASARDSSLALWSTRLMPAHQGSSPSSVTWAFSLQDGPQATEQEGASRGRTGGGGQRANPDHPWGTAASHNTIRADKGDKEYQPGSRQASSRPGRQQAQGTHTGPGGQGLFREFQKLGLKQTVDGSSLGLAGSMA